MKDKRVKKSIVLGGAQMKRISLTRADAISEVKMGLETTRVAIFEAVGVSACFGHFHDVADQRGPTALARRAAVSA